MHAYQVRPVPAEGLPAGASLATGCDIPKMLFPSGTKVVRQNDAEWKVNKVSFSTNITSEAVDEDEFEEGKEKVKGLDDTAAEGARCDCLLDRENFFNVCPHKVLVQSRANLAAQSSLANWGCSRVYYEELLGGIKVHGAHAHHCMPSHANASRKHSDAYLTSRFAQTGRLIS